MERSRPPGRDPEEEWASRQPCNQTHTVQDEPSYFMSPKSSDQILSLVQTCQESRHLVQESYTLLFPVSSTWFSFEKDFLYLDFNKSPHILDVLPRSFTESLHDPQHMPNHLELARYLPKKYDEILIKRVKKLVLGDVDEAFCGGRRHADIFRKKLLAVFTGVEVLAFVDRVAKFSYEAGEELVWLRGEIGEELVAKSSLEITPTVWSWRGQDFDLEQGYRALWRDIQLWETRTHRYSFEVPVEDIFIEGLEAATRQPTPVVVKKIITTANVKRRLLQICGSEDNLRALGGLNWNFVAGMDTYHGSLTYSQQILFLELVMDMISVVCHQVCKGKRECCKGYEIMYSLEEGVFELKAKIKELGFESLFVHEAEEEV